MLGLILKLFIKAIGGTRNERIVRSYLKFVTEEVNPLEEQFRGLSDEGLLAQSEGLRARLAAGESRDAIKPEAFALVREASRRGRDHRQFDVQLVAGMVLDQGWIAEEATGEGKTIACYPAIYMAVLEGMHVHVVTVSDYHVKRDATFAQPIFALLGISVGYIQTGMSPGERQPQYACDITYGTNSEFGFDYLRDNMKLSVPDQVQGPLDFAIVDEVDSILIDEARTPLILSGESHGQTDQFRKADAVARELVQRHRPWDQANRAVEALKRQLKALGGEQGRAKGDEAAGKIDRQIAKVEADLDAAEEQLARCTKYYEVELDKKSAHMTDEGVGVAQEVAGIGSFYVGANMEWPHLMEQALRAHLVYEKDKEYVVQNGQVVIVDEFTGRLMEGREWSHGLHQAVEAKERVAIKEENQTMATITIQNFFKMYRKLAGMTGTAMTEAGEFLKIYKLDVVSVPTHRAVNRMDHNDRIYATPDAKYDAIVEEVNAVSKAGRPVLVGTTSVEKSETLSEMLLRRYGVDHQVLNARPEHAAREADIVAEAGTQHPLKKGSKKMVGTVTIATNMAGRGTDIKLGRGVVYAACRVPPPEKLAELGVAEDPLFPSGTNKCCIHCPQYDPGTGCAHCFKPKIEEAFPLRGRTDCTEEVPCGLHIVGTERHEARRIDNQLRGRSGRQGDPGSSRFFLSIRDELMAVFAGEWTVKVLGWLGLQGDVAIEDRRVSKGIERAQRKVEERNFEMRKNLLEYDEVKDHQRRGFYSQRQQVLEGRQLDVLIRQMVRDAIDDGVETYLDGHHHRRCIAEWARTNLQISVDESRIRAETPEEFPDLEQDLRGRARDEAVNVIGVTLGEYMDEEEDRKHWDLRGLSAWAMSRFNVNLSQNQLRKMTSEEVEPALTEAAFERIQKIDLTPLAEFLEPDLAARALVEWAQSKLGIDVDLAEMPHEPETARELLQDKAETAYRRREIEYPVEYALDMTIGQSGPDNVYALGALAEWANRKYDAEFTADQLREMKVEDIRRQLTELSEAWLTGDKLQESIRQGLGSDPTAEAAAEFAHQRYDTELTPEDLDGDVVGKIVEVGRGFLRREMTELERFLLLQIFDTSWVEHLLAMDHLESSIGLRGYAEQDPRVAFKREGARLFQETLAGMRDKVTDLIFKVRLTSETEMVDVYQVSDAVHEQLSGYDYLAQEMAAQQAAATSERVETIIRDAPRVGRNDPCPCGSGRKFKKCCGKVA